MHPPSRVTIIIATYNRAHLLKETLESIKNQTIPAYQIILVDDGSCDSTEEVVREFPLAIDYVKKTNGGKASAINSATSLIKGDSIIVFDDDDLLSPTSIATHLEKFSENRDIFFTYSGNHIGVSNPEERIKVIGTDLLEGIDHQNLFISTLNRCQTLMQGMLIRREAFEATLPFNEVLTRSQDYDFMLRLMQKYPGKFVKDPTFTLREHSGTRGSRENNFSAEKKMIKWLEYDRIILANLFETIKNDYTDLSTSSPTSRFENTYLMLFCAYAGRALWNESIYFLTKIHGNKKYPLSNKEKLILHGAIRKSTLEWITKSSSEKALFFKSLLTMPNSIKLEIIRALLWQSGSHFKFVKKIFL